MRGSFWIISQRNFWEICEEEMFIRYDIIIILHYFIFMGWLKSKNGIFSEEHTAGTSLLGGLCVFGCPDLFNDAKYERSSKWWNFRMKIFMGVHDIMIKGRPKFQRKIISWLEIKNMESLIWNRAGWWPDQPW